ncbi:hypothetical protein [Mesorhizobium sp. M2A.F.Ca.ET.067.02.1.1]|uniref:hypothetical protein n=1 Tax=Mesorhizobium sp. M2A.F.Ca.ET.067.02.1.1 TaxID=2496749 RepID=UPI000FD3AAFD|nr:hypothetical protein [Mesorhizobium sp. M2A.F.Ca.ET.067.02.1.1]RUW79627.1 hypothetical protein EOA28_07470 [Mesorhizobium sp. M2A.F.Ca.ET.067.02.1.1]
MADNVAITQGAGTSIAADDVSGVLHQRVKISLGADGVATDALGGAGAVAAGVQRVTLASDDPAVATLGATSGAAVTTDANGTLQQYLRGLVKQWIAGTLVIGAGTSLIGKVKTKFIEAAAATMTRPADTNAYTANDAVANNTSAGSVTALSFSVSDVNDDTITLERLRLITSDTGAQGKNFRVWLYRVAVTPGAGDNAAFTAPRGSFIGTMSGTLRAMSDGAAGILVPDEGARIIAKPVSGAQTVIALIQTLDAFTPLSASTWIATLEGFQGAA